MFPHLALNGGQKIYEILMKSRKISYCDVSTVLFNLSQININNNVPQIYPLLPPMAKS